ncbi:MAG TPA: molybdate ABC transporter substrate-binding protein, partial [Thermoanaerobaculia bacterium]|nr:molybdate ABC transporter substrate-binding protein [Thermoanaerobaculia bacterium]
RVYAAARLTESLEEHGKACEAKTGAAARFSFGASSDLARQIQAGAPADVFFSADTAKMDALEKAGIVRHADRREFLSNQLVVVVPIASSLGVAGARDLARLPHLALADPEAVPAGIYARKWLEAEGVWAELRPKLVPTLDVRATLAAVESGAVEAGIVYRTDSAISNKVRVVLVVTNGPAITYSVARIASSRSSAARRFVDRVAGAEGRAVFERRGFTVLK